MPVYTNGLEITAPRGPAGPDGNPIGTVLSYMGLTAPTDYLICDGATYDIAAYSDLAKFFEVQFGSCNFFGGDGETTFAVPDMRDLFLRGYNPDEGRLSDEIGMKQEATTIPHLELDAINGVNVLYPTDSGASRIENYDAALVGTARYVGGTEYGSIEENRKYAYAIRPINMTVNFIIKAVTSVPAENVYSTEERVVGRWIDGKLIYEKIFMFKTLSIGNGDSSEFASASELDIDEFIGGHWNGVLVTTGEMFLNGATFVSLNKNISVLNNGFTIGSYIFDATAVIRYTKTTD